VDEDYRQRLFANQGPGEKLDELDLLDATARGEAGPRPPGHGEGDRGGGSESGAGALSEQVARIARIARNV